MPVADDRNDLTDANCTVGAFLRDSALRSLDDGRNDGTSGQQQVDALAVHRQSSTVKGEWPLAAAEGDR